MPNPYFKFKQFTIYHDKCAMKVGTDGVLLGAWTNVGDSTSLLDIGCGSGLIALMLAQRCNRESIVEAIDMDADAVMQAQINAEKSPFNNVNIHHYSLQDFVEKTTKRYDCIVSNPPFFISSLKSPIAQRSLARHNDYLSAEDLLLLSKSLLSEQGKLSIIYPHQEKEYLLKLAEQHNLNPIHITNVYPTPKSLPKRILLELSTQYRVAQETDIVIEKERHIYTNEFKRLTEDFYLEKT